MPLLVALLTGLAGPGQAEAAQGGPAHTPPADAPGRCSDAVLRRLAGHFGVEHLAYPARGRSPGIDNGGLIVSGVCKPWPDDSGRTITAIAYDAGNADEKRLLVAVVAGPDHRVVASHAGAILEDAATALSEHALSIDTARYMLAPGNRAFGLRWNSFRDRCTYEGGFGDEFRLFVIDGPRLRSVLAATLREWSYAPGDRCSGQDTPRTDISTAISVERSSSHGLADLRLTATRSDSGQHLSPPGRPKGEDRKAQPAGTPVRPPGQPNGEDRKAQPAGTPVSAVVRYDGRQYDLRPWSVAYKAVRP